MGRVVVSGYLVRNPLGGYVWQAAHYLLGVRALGHDVWFYEDTGLYEHAYNPVTNEFGAAYDYGVRATGEFLERLGLGSHWVFVDTASGGEHGPGAGRTAEILRDADVLLSIAGINRILPEQRGGRPSVFVDIDPAFTQIKAADGDRVVREVLDAHVAHFTYGENIGTARSPVPDAGYRWRPTRAPVAIDQWAGTRPRTRAYTTVGRWNETQRDLVFGGQTFQWRKRTEWLRCLDLPARTGNEFEIAMDVESVAGDPGVLRSHGWRIADPRAISGDPWRYRDFIRGSRGEFTVAKDLNVRLRSGWFSDRAACYLAAGRPVVVQDTAFGDVLPVGEGIRAFRTVAEAAEAIAAIEADYPRAAANALEVARAHFDAARVVAPLLAAGGL